MIAEKKIEIYVQRGEHRLGPFSLEEVRSKLESEELMPKEPAWHAGLTSWISLGVVLNAEVDKLAPKHSRAGISSAVLAGMSLLAVLVLLFSFMLEDYMGKDGTLFLIRSLVFMGLVGSSLSGMVLGFVGSFAKKSKQEWVLTGLVVNGLILLVVALICYLVAYKMLR